MGKLELKHLACYLPYGLKVQYTNQEGESSVHEIIGFKDDGIVTFQDGSKIRHLHLALKSGSRMSQYFYTHTSFKPILRPLSEYFDITSPAMKELNLSISDQIALANIASGIYHTSELPYRLICRLAEEHIDFMGLIPAGLAISYKEAGL